ncbi:putative uncharacterized protein [Parachlamydia acanthamoebae UV-7]|uniref:Uncharacterized protein n=2 Tax=Parachlamydia acanthamoebae TaxID=83552 RepID=F8L0N0_PARAV|nr:hypothetical protein [Parachlamydia acanthamoebae]KIA77473.1 hypothetical protein DB43_GF00150 [Parachlamydia acanthamoebae]CCB86780.1 putative uncharacterized protein [Parachlamydia acanthamoebae UV-7]
MLDEKISELKNRLMQNRNSELQAEAIIHALIDIEESFQTVYKEMIPKLLQNNLTNAEFMDLLWDIRDQFQHIDYHIHDGNLINL